MPSRRMPAYNQEIFFVRHARLVVANDPCSAVKATLPAEVEPGEARAGPNSDTSRPSARPRSERIAVKLINNLAHEVMKVFRI